MENTTVTSNRLMSLDFMRGLIMVLLVLESTMLYEHLAEVSEGSWLHHFFAQFFHHPWNGLRFWDIIQPGFMFIAGTAMAYSLVRQEQLGVPWNDRLKKVLIRCFWLFFWGVLNYAVQRDGTLSFELWNVLTQLSFTTLVAFLIFRWPYLWQIIFSAGLLLLTEILYRFTNIPGFDQPFTDQHNFGNYMDLILMNQINSDGWVAINALPTAVHTIAGAIVGKIFLTEDRKIRPLLIAGFSSLLIGYFLEFADITPIIKRIATSSFTIVTLGWCLLALALAYWWIDVKNHKRNLQFFTIVGMNSLFIYLFFEIIGHRWFNEYAGAIGRGVFGWLHLPEHLINILVSLMIFGLEWYLCYFLYRKKIFFKI